MLDQESSLLAKTCSKSRRETKVLKTSMATRLFVGNLPYNTTDDQLQQFFASAGTVSSATVVMDRRTGRSRGFGFVEMSSDEEAQSAISQLNGKEMDGRAIVVTEARERAPREGNE